MSSSSPYKKLYRNLTDGSVIEESLPPPQHEIKVVPVEDLQNSEDDDSNGEEEDDDSSMEEEEESSDLESLSSEEELDIKPEIEVPVEVASNSQPTTSAASASGSTGNKKVNCLFCYRPVAQFVTNKPFHRRILNNTCQRLFKYICEHLTIDHAAFRPPNRGPRSGRPPVPKEAQLLPGFLPLCTRCRELYYNNIYEQFVTYEASVLKLGEQIAACITRTIGVSAKENDGSVESGAMNEDMFDSYEKSENEHEVMKAVRRFRQKVVERNPAGYADNPDPAGLTQSQAAVKLANARNKAKSIIITHGSATGNQVDSQEGSSETVKVGPTLKNVIKIVKNRSDMLQRDKINGKAVDRLDNVKREMDRANDGTESDDGQETGLNYYAVANPEPGVIQIIPVVVGESGQAIPSASLSMGGYNTAKSRKRSAREDYQKQRIARNTCKFCNKYFEGQSLLQRHQVKVHGLEKPYKCPHCDYRAIDRASLKSHLTTHLDESAKEDAKKFTCHICGLKFSGKGGLAGHIRGHLGEKPFVCEVCGKAFSSNTSRQLCLDKHQGLKHHKCSYCEKTFLRKEVLKIHERTHTGERPFKCHVCGKAFAQRSPLNIHLKMHKRKDPSLVIKKNK